MKAGLPFWWQKNNILNAIILLLYSLVANSNVVPKEIGYAKDYMEKGDFAKAYCLIEPLAEQGNPSAQHLLGWMYHNGYGLAIDDEQTLDWWYKAAEQGFSDAEYSLAVMYELGEGVRRDLFKAMEFYLSAARKGHQDARSSLKQILLNRYQEVFQYLLDISRNEYHLFDPQYQIRVKRANIRSAPSPKDKIVTVLQKETKLIVLKKQGNWSEIILPAKGKLAWVYSPLLEKVGSENTQVSSASSEKAIPEKNRD